jgi:hypothetical protein
LFASLLVSLSVAGKLHCSGYIFSGEGSEEQKREISKKVKNDEPIVIHVEMQMPPEDARPESSILN